MLRLNFFDDNVYLRPKIKTFVLCAVLWSLLLPFASQTSAQIKQERKLPQLGGYTFIPSGRVREPFVTTYVRSATGGGAAINIDIPVFDAEGNEVGTFQGDLGFLLLSFEYQQALSNWLALHTKVDGLARVGINEESVLAQGVSAVGGFELGALLGIVKTDRIALSFDAKIRRATLVGVDLLSFALSIIENDGLVKDNKLLDKTGSTLAAGALRFAWGLNNWAGVNLVAELGTAQGLQEEADDKLLTTFGGTVGVDFGAGLPVDVGLLLGYVQNSFPENGDDIAKNIRSFIARLDYTGRREFSIGLEMVFQRAPLVARDQTLQTVSGFLTLRYYF